MQLFPACLWWDMPPSAQGWAVVFVEESLGFDKGGVQSLGLLLLASLCGDGPIPIMVPKGLVCTVLVCRLFHASCLACWCFAQQCWGFGPPITFRRDLYTAHSQARAGNILEGHTWCLCCSCCGCESTQYHVSSLGPPCCSKIAEAEAAVSVNEKKWCRHVLYEFLLGHVHW